MTELVIVLKLTVKGCNKIQQDKHNCSQFTQTH